MDEKIPWAYVRDENIDAKTREEEEKKITYLSDDTCVEEPRQYSEVYHSRRKGLPLRRSTRLRYEASLRNKNVLVILVPHLAGASNV